MWGVDRASLGLYEGNEPRGCHSLFHSSCCYRKFYRKLYLNSLIVSSLFSINHIIRSNKYEQLDCCVRRYRHFAGSKFNSIDQPDSARSSLPPKLPLYPHLLVLCQARLQKKKITSMLDFWKFPSSRIHAFYIFTIFQYFFPLLLFSSSLFCECSCRKNHIHPR